MDAPDVAAAQLTAQAHRALTPEGARAASALPEVLHDRPAATLLVDLESASVVYANRLATELAPGTTLPVSLAEWSDRAGLETLDGRPLRDGPHPLEQIARGAPPRGVKLSAAHASAAVAARDAMWAVGVPLTDAPGPLARQSLVVLLGTDEAEGVRALQTLGDDLHARAAIASELSFTISDPSRPDDPLIWVNPAFERVTGYRAEDVLGQNCRFLQGRDTDRAAVRRIREALDAGVTVADTLLNYRADGTPFWNQVVISPVLDAEGRVTHHVGIQADVTARVRDQQERDAALHQAAVSSDRLQLLAEVSGMLAQHLDLTEAVQGLADLVVPRLGTWGYVALTSDRGRVDRLHVATRDPRLIDDALALEHEELTWLTRSPVIAAALTSEPTHVPEPFDVDVAAVSTRTTASQLAILDRLGMGSALVVPLRARDRVLGVLVLVMAEQGAFSAETVVTAAHIGYRAGLGLDNVRLYQRERDAALTLQRSLLPEVPQIPGLDIAASYQPAGRRAQVGGDWFDVLRLPDGAVGLAVGDVVGHDLSAAASMGQLRSVLRSYAWSGLGAADVVTRLDELVRGLGMADLSTCIYLRLDGTQLRWSRAGHPPALLRLPGGHVEWLEGGLTTPIGVPSPQGGAGEGARELPEGALLVVYTDGLVERRDRTLRAGIESLAAAMAALPDGVTADVARDHLLEGLHGPGQEDDVCVLVVRRT